VPRGGDIFDGKFVPGGTNIGACVWSIQRVKSVFGENADMYRPERWLEASGDQLQRTEKTNDLVFAHGRYQCLGKNVAMIELRKVFVEVRKCDAELSIATSILWPWVCLRAHPRKSVFLAIFPGLAKPKSVTLPYIYLTTTKHIIFKLERIR
jgi:hypothetical protein